MEEQAEDRESTKSDVKLGRLQFRIDYDFNQSNVSESWPSLLVFIECLDSQPLIFSVEQEGYSSFALVPSFSSFHEMDTLTWEKHVYTETIMTTFVCRQ